MDLLLQQACSSGHAKVWTARLVNRVNCKQLKLLGLEKTYIYVYHKNHVNNRMVITYTTFAFDGNIKNSGNSVKLGFFRCQDARIAKRIFPQFQCNKNDVQVPNRDVVC